MLKLLWFIPRPAQDIEGFEDWYQNQHVANGMRQELLQRFRICRSFYPQPAFVTQANGTDEPRAYRFSEGYWETVEDMRHCYVSPNGRAALSDGPLNILPGRTPATPQPVLVVEEEFFPVVQELSFHVPTGCYQHPLACKLFGFVRLREGRAAEFEARYKALAAKVADDPELRRHVLGRSLDAVIRPGRVVQWPPIGAEHYDRTLEYYFDSRESLDRFCASPWIGEVQALTGDLGEAIAWDAARIQEVFYTSKGDQPLEDSWKARYAD